MRKPSDLQTQTSGNAESSEDFDRIIRVVGMDGLDHQIGWRVEPKIDVVLPVLRSDRCVIGQVEALVRLDARLLVVPVEGHLPRRNIRNVEADADFFHERSRPDAEIPVKVRGGHEE